MNYLRTSSKYFLIFLSLFGLAAHAEDWKISGLVLEKGTRKPLSGAYVAVQEMDSISTLSGDDGSFELSLSKAGHYTLVAATLGGAAPVSIPVELKPGKAIPPLTFYLPSATLLPEVVVNAERSPDRVSKSVISGAELRKVPGSSGDPLKSIQALPGVIAAGNGSQPAVRGSGPGDNLYYVDGLIVGKIFHVGGISVFNADLIQDFNLYSAAFAPHYGDITGAVLDVALRDPRTDRVGGKVNINLIGADFLVEGPTAENQSGYFAARRSYIDLLLKQVTQRGVTLQIPNYSDYQGKYLWKLNGTDKLTLHVQGATDQLKLSIDSNSDIAKQQPVLSGDISASDSYSMQALVWDAQSGGGSQNKLALEHISNISNQNIASAGSVTLTSNNYLLLNLAHIPAGEGNELILGSNLGYAKIDVNADTIKTTCTQFQASCDLSSAPHATLVETLNANAWEFSAEDRNRITPGFTLIGGVHHSGEDYLKKSYTEPRLGAEWDWDDRTLLTAGWGLHNQMPAGQQIVQTFGNPHLDHIRAQHSVLGIARKLDSDWSWKAETYYKKFTGLVLGDALQNYINGGSGTALGAELLIKKEGVSDLTGWLSVSLARSQRQNDVTGESFRFAYDEPINTSLVTSYKLNEKWTMGAKWTFHSGAPYTPITGATQDSTGRYIPVYAAVNSGTLPNYHQLDLRFDRNYVFNRWKLNTYFELNNVYFHQNISGYRYDATYSNKEPVSPLVIPFTFGVQGEF